MASQLLLGAIAFLPALATLYFVVGAQEQFFRDQAMFLAMIGGLVLGLLVAIAEAVMLTDAGLLFVVIAFPLVETMAKTMLVGLPRFRDEPEAVLLGGAAGAMLAAMVLVYYTRTLAADPLTWQMAVKVVGASVGFTGAHFVSGLRLGQGPAQGSVLGGFLPSFGWLMPAHVLLAPLLIGFEDLALRPLQGLWVWAIPLAIYGLAIFIWRTPDLIVKGLPKEERRRYRREQRRSGG